jgi:hypothetical protein
VDGGDFTADQNLGVVCFSYAGGSNGMDMDSDGLAFSGVSKEATNLAYPPR